MEVIQQKRNTTPCSIFNNELKNTYCYSDTDDSTDEEEGKDIEANWNMLEMCTGLTRDSIHQSKLDEERKEEAELIFMHVVHES